jgi:hypothetical protein
MAGAKQPPTEPEIWSGQKMLSSISYRSLLSLVQILKNRFNPEKTGPIRLIIPLLPTHCQPDNNPGL